MRRLAILSLLMVVPSACGNDEDPQASSGGTGEGGGDETSGGGEVGEGDGEDEGDEGQGATGDSGVDDTGSGGDGADDGGDEGGEDPPPTEPPPATGIQIVEVSVDQGVRVPVYRSGVLLDPSQHNVPILKGRPGVVRGFYEVDPGFETRDIYALLYVTQADGRETTYESFVTASVYECEAQALIDCRYGTLPASFFWRLREEDMQPGVTMRAELFETSPGNEDVVSDKIPVFPTDGSTMPLGVAESYMKMRVVIVPFDHDIGAECPEPPDLNAEQGTDIYGNPRTVAEYFGERLLAQNPADEVEMIVHDVVRFTGSLRGSQLLSTLQQLRAQEGAPPNYYYYGVARPCDGGPDFAGVAQIGSPSRGAASRRVGWGVYYQNIGTTAETFVHEIGHEQGRAHVACNGDEGGPDPSYPDHPNGSLQNYGIDVINNAIKVYKPIDKDYMSYCGSTWVSEWGWRLVTPWIAEMSSWELEDGARETSATRRPLLVGNVRADGTRDFYVTMGWFDDNAGVDDHKVRYTLEGAEYEVSGTWTQWRHSNDYNFIAPLPVNHAAVDDLRWTDGGREHRLDRASLRFVGPTDLTLGTP